MVASGAREAWRYERLWKELDGIPYPDAIRVAKMSFITMSVGTFALAGLTTYAFFALKKWAKRT
jgi:hypothetical protein